MMNNMFEIYLIKSQDYFYGRHTSQKADLHSKHYNWTETILTCQKKIRMHSFEHQMSQESLLSVAKFKSDSTCLIVQCKAQNASMEVLLAIYFLDG